MRILVCFGVALVGIGFPGLAGCVSKQVDSGSANATSCEGATWDDWGYCRLPNGRFANHSCCELQQAEALRCTVVWVNPYVNGQLFEEGFGSVYDIDPDYGYNMTDSDADEVVIMPGEYVSLGHYSFHIDDGDMVQSLGRRSEGGPEY